ncbi:hypothetical protein T492DRAFT_587903, partial [Pavlovales sp. CCMP2436]
LYPSEAASDFAFIPFGGGERKCVGDQFASLEVNRRLLLYNSYFNVPRLAARRRTGLP